MARALPEDFRGRVLTNSVPVAMELSAGRRSSCCCPAGRCGAGDAACYGAQADAFFAEVYADKAFLGSGGVHAEAGLTDYYPHEVATRRVIIAHAAASYVLADSSKLGTVAVHRVCALDPGNRRHHRRRQPAREAVDALAAAGCDLLAPEGGPRGSAGTGSPPNAGHRASPRGRREPMDQVTTSASRGR